MQNIQLNMQMFTQCVLISCMQIVNLFLIYNQSSVQFGSDGYNYRETILVSNSEKFSYLKVSADFVHVLAIANLILVAVV